MEGMESAYQRKEKHMKSMCKFCKSEAHTSLEHHKHYKGFHEEQKERRAEKHMKMWTEKEDDADDKKRGIKEGSKEDVKIDHSRGLAKKHMKSFDTSTRKTGTFEGKSNALGHGGRAAQLEARGVPGGVIGNMARRAQAAPGQKNYHGHRKSNPTLMQFGRTETEGPAGRAPVKNANSTPMTSTPNVHAKKKA